nr:LamG-like jellyroll fold domain-containing protein [uncultured Carboxylicivirga sp.]
MKKLISALLVVLCFSTGWAQNKIKGWEYWFDDATESMTILNITPSESFVLASNIATDDLTDGLHRINLRFIDENNLSSTTLSQFFFKFDTETTGIELTEVEYWFDSNYENKVNQSIIGQTVWEPVLDLSGLNLGLHTIHIRFKDSKGKWSTTLSQFIFTKDVEQSASMKAWQYWIDNDLSSVVTTNITSNTEVSLSTALDLSEMNTGVHTFNIRFLDDQNRWTVTHSKFFYKKESKNLTGNTITAYQFWLDDKIEEVYTIATSPTQLISLSEAIDFTTLVAGTHDIHFRFLDETGVWSSAISNTFIKESLSIEDGLIAHYPLDANGDDQSVYQHHGTLNETTSVTDRFGNTDAALYFDGINDYVRIPDADHLDINNSEPFSVSLWLKQDAENISKYFISKYNPALGSKGAYGFGTGYTGDAYSWFYFNDEGGKENRGSIELNDGNWHHYVAVYKPGENITLYIDNQSDITQTITYTGNTINTTDLLIGCGANISQYFKGSLDDIRIYKRALSTEEINGLYSYVPTKNSVLEIPGTKVYPNPVNDILHVSIPDDGATLYLYDINGNCIFSKIIQKSQVDIPFNNLIEGLYFLQIRTTKGQQSFRIIRN